MDTTLAGIIALVVLIILDAFFTAAGTAFSNARRHLLRERADQGDQRARRAVDVAEDSTSVLSTFQLATLLTHFLMGSVLILLLLVSIPVWLDRLIPALGLYRYAISIFIGIPIAAFVIYSLGELLPEVIVQRNAERWAVALAAPARATIFLFSPLVAITARLRRAVSGAQPGSADASMVTEEEIMTLVDAGEEEGAIEMEEKEMIYSVFQLDETLAREIMLPRIDIVALDINTPMEEAVALIIESGHSRIPLYEDSLDHVIGLLYAKDILKVWKDDKKSVKLTSLMRKTHFVPETKRVLDLLRELQLAKVHMAVVIDEYGGTAGLVTIEDIVEEIVGEIRDEYDLAEEAPYQRVGPDEFIVDARISIGDLNHQLEVNLPSDEADTLGGFIYEQLGKVPDSGDTLEASHAKLEVLSTVGKRIGKVRVIREAPPATKNGTTNVTETKSI